MAEKLPFKPKARIMVHLGEQLIKNESIAVLELVKNSYDAFATKVDVTMDNLDDNSKGIIIVEDNGFGMNLDIVKNTWMVPGTESKKLIIDQLMIDKSKIRSKRVPMGEKGIGRFGIHKLGNRIRVITKMKGYEEVVIDIDWREFDNAEYLDVVGVIVSEREPIVFKNGNTGTRIEISDLKGKWTKGKLRDLYRSLNSFNSPFKNIESFEVCFSTNKRDWIKGLLSFEDIKKYALYEADVIISGSELSQYRYKFKPWMNRSNLKPRANRESHIEMFYETKNIDEENNRSKIKVPINLSKYKIGKVGIKLLIFDLDASILSEGVDDKKGLKEYLRKNGGISVYRDGIKVYEYGDEGNDWLNLGLKRINSPTRFLSSNIVIGAVYIKRLESSDLIEKTNREGFIENEAFQEFKSGVSFAIEKIQNDRELDKTDLRLVYGSDKRKEPVMGEITTLREKVEKNALDNKLKKEILGCLSNIEDDYKYITDVYLNSSNTGMSLSIVIHEIEKIILELKKAVEIEPSTMHVRNLVNDLSHVTDGYANLVRSKGKCNIDLKKILNKSIRNTRYRLRAHEIEVIEAYKEFESESILSCIENLMICTIINIFDNSIWWMTNDKIKEKKIYLGITDEIDGYISIVIADNGRGFRLPTDKITRPFVTGKPGGMGLGLHLAYEIMEAQGGQLIFPDKGDIKLPDEFEQGAVIVLALKKEEKI